MLYLKQLFLSLAGTYLHFTDEVFGGSFHPVYLLDLSDLLMVIPVVSTLAPDINMLAPVTRIPLDLFHLLV
jgi:hypothetical protein